MVSCEFVFYRLDPTDDYSSPRR